MSAVLYTTFAFIDNNLMTATLRALTANLNNSAVSKIVVVTESEISEITRNCHELDCSDIEFVRLKKRPTFGDMFEIINKKMTILPGTISILLNSDISILSAETVYRLEESIHDVSKKYKKVAFSLTRYDPNDIGYEIVLKSGMGLPNVLSADAWVFNSKIVTNKDFYYSMGQMYCDKFVNHDLIESGYKLYNPSMDCVIIHNEDSVKDASYYAALGNQDDSKHAIQKHIRLSVKKGGNYYGLPRLYSTSMCAGYLPEPVEYSQSRKRLLIFLDSIEYSIDQYLHKVTNQLNLSAGIDLDVYFVVDDRERHIMIDAALAELQIDTSVYNYFVDSIDTIIANLFNGLHDTYESIGYTRSWDCIAPNFLDISGTIFFDTRKSSIVNDIDENMKPLSSVKMMSKRQAYFKKIIGTLHNLFGAPSFDKNIWQSVAVTAYSRETRLALLNKFSHDSVKLLLFCSDNRAQSITNKHRLYNN